MKAAAAAASSARRPAFAGLDTVDRELYSVREDIGMQEARATLRGQNDRSRAETLVGKSGWLHAPLLEQARAQLVPLAHALPLTAAALPVGAAASAAAAPEPACSALPQRIDRLSLERIPYRCAYVLNWENFLVDEIGFSYEITNNALATLRTRDSLFRAAMRASPKNANSAQLFGTTIIEMAKASYVRYLRKHPELKTSAVLHDYIAHHFRKATVSEHEKLHQRAMIEVQRQYHQYFNQDARMALNATPVSQLSAPMTSLPVDTPIDLPFPDVQLQLVPGARAWLDCLNRRPDIAVVLLSDRRQADVDREVSHLRLQQYFDIVSGRRTFVIPAISISATALAQPSPASLRILHEALTEYDAGYLKEVLSYLSPYAHPESVHLQLESGKHDGKRLLHAVKKLHLTQHTVIVAAGHQLRDATLLRVLSPGFPKRQGVIVEANRSQALNAMAAEASVRLGVPMIFWPHVPNTSESAQGFASWCRYPVM